MADDEKLKELIKKLHEFQKKNLEDLYKEAQGGDRIGFLNEIFELLVRFSRLGHQLSLKWEQAD